MTISEKVQAKLRKLQALAERGVGGEKETAQRMLTKLMERHGITMDAIDEERRETRWFSVRGRLERRLLVQIASKVIDGYDRTYYRKRGAPKSIGIDASAAEAIELGLYYDVLRKALADHTEAAFQAFIIANSVFAPGGGSEKEELTERDLQILAMAHATSPTQVNKRLGAPIRGGSSDLFS